MLNTFIKNRGSTKTIIHNSNSSNNSHNDLNAVNEIKWDADYDGDVANISVISDTNGQKKHFNITLDNNDLEHILNIPSVDMPIHKRLKMDFEEPYYKPEFESIKPKYIEEIDRRITTPLSGEELIIPLTIHEKSNNFKTRDKKHRHPKTHITHRVYKKLKVKSKSTPRHKLKTKNKSRSSRRKTIPIIDLF